MFSVGLFLFMYFIAGIEPFHSRKTTGVAHNVNAASVGFRSGGVPVETQLVYEQ